MSTRSGKRIHGSFHGNISRRDEEQVVDSARKTRSKRMKENVEKSEALSVCLPKNKRTNYVSYPTDADEDVITDVNDKEVVMKPTRLLRKNALKELNLITFSAEKSEPPVDVKIRARTTRSTRKFVVEVVEDVQEDQKHVDAEEIQKSRKGKKKKHFEQKDADENVSKKKVSRNKGKGVRSGSMIVEDIESESAQTKRLIKMCNMSSDSFHSAVGSPQREEIQESNVPFDMFISLHRDVEVINTSAMKNLIVENCTEKPERRRTRSLSKQSNINTTLTSPNETLKESRKRKSSVKHLGVDENESFEPLNSTLNRSKKRKSSIKEARYEEKSMNGTIDTEIINSTFDLENIAIQKSINNVSFDKTEGTDAINSSYNIVDAAVTRKSTCKDSTFDMNIKTDERNATFDKETPILDSANKLQTNKSFINTTFEISSNSFQADFITDSCDERKSIIINTTLENNTDTNNEPQTRSSIKNITYDKELPMEMHSEADGTKDLIKARLSIPCSKLSTELNNTYDKLSIPCSKSSTELNNTYDKLFISRSKSSSELNDTYDKSDPTYDKDKKLDATFDENQKNSLISSDNSSNITSDKIDASQISITSDDSSENIVNMTPVLIESSLDESSILTADLTLKNTQPPLTPLKREGTFTKDSNDEPPKPDEPKTPTKRMSLPSPGCTPFHVNKSSTKKSVLNVTQSVEKSRRSSLVEPLPRATKVMFCSPVNSPAMVMQQRRKVIKSNLKGSNKSFVFEETGGNEPRAAPRKRSYTHNDADDTRVKRKRLADGLQHSVERLSRPRTCSASGKLADPNTPTKKAVTPRKSEAKIPRTKLPNFAALHQKQFDKMESLGECQQRRAKRAKQLLTPTGTITVLERSISPKENESEQKPSSSTEPQKQKKEKEQNHAKIPKEPPKKPDTPVKSLPTLKSLNPGYTRFGFKLNLDANPFSVPKKSDAKNESTSKITPRIGSKAKTSLFSFTSKKSDTKPLDIGRNSKRETLPSKVGATSVRKEVAKQTVMREKSFTDRMKLNRIGNRTVIKGVRTNRRFDLQMRMRDLE